MDEADKVDNFTGRTFTLKFSSDWKDDTDPLRKRIKVLEKPKLTLINKIKKRLGLNYAYTYKCEIL